MNKTTPAALFLAALTLFWSPVLEAGRFFVDRKTGKTVIELTVDGLPNTTGTDVNNRANAAIVNNFVTNLPASAIP